MYDVEMMRMLNLIHVENQYIFELVRAGLFLKEDRETITFDAYEKEYKRIMKDVEKYSPCFDCSYKNRFEKIRNIAKERSKDEVKE